MNDNLVTTILESLASIAETYRTTGNMKEALEQFEKKIPGRELTPQLLMKCATNLKEKKYKKG